MGASTNVTTVFCGTVWTSSTLLARELRSALEAQEKDGVLRVFRIDADQVAAEVPAYGEYVAKQVARLGRNHPVIKTQYYGEEIDAEAGMFPPARRILMQGSHAYLELLLSKCSQVSAQKFALHWGLPLTRSDIPSTRLAPDVATTEV
jgi:hypothetical protein